MGKQEQPSASELVRAELNRMAAQFKAALPPHIRVEQFIRVVLTAINSDPELLQADRRSLFEAATKAAQDGLLPDKREGAFVVYNTNIGGKNNPKWIKKVQWQVMVGGICKKARNSGEIKVIDALVVYENDEYESWHDETGAHFKHKPARRKARGKPYLTYAYAITKDGALFFEELDEEDIEAIRNVSKAKDSGPWAGDFQDEMRRKSAIRRLGKYRLPTSAVVDELIRRDDELYDLTQLGGDPLTQLSATSESQPALGEGNGSEDGSTKKEEGPPPEAVFEEALEAIKQATVENFMETKASVHKTIAKLKGHEKLILELTRALNEKQQQLKSAGNEK